MMRNTIPLLHLVTIFLTIILMLPSSTCSEDARYATCSSSLFHCGEFESIGYPFWGNGRPDYCGHPGFELDCEDNVTTMQIRDVKYYVKDIEPKMSLLKIARWDFRGNVCPDKYLPNTTLDNTPFNYSSADEIATLFYNCSVSYSSLNEFICDIGGRAYLNINTTTELAKQLALTCKVGVVVPILKMVIEALINHTLDVLTVLNEGFEIKYWIVDETVCVDCTNSGGLCGYNTTTTKFTCFCVNGAHPRTCLDQVPPPPVNHPISASKEGHGLNLGLKFLIGFGAAGLSIIMMLAIFFIYQRRYKKRYLESSYVSRNISDDYSSMTDLEKMGNFFGVNIFTYAELEEATNRFDPSKELGDGGFGTVYHGKLKDGRVVAVKRLYENNYKRVEQFMNEVEILTRLRHQNLVLLYGCTSRLSHELLLVYEYIPNGTVADHLHGEKANPGSLQWPTRLNIAIETACALTYLHACEIIHRDVKTNNILLDNNFCVKVADFGLSRLFPTDVTHVSTAPQGTPGYVDPDYHQCYQLTDKSDVYSFGVVLIELISSKPAVDITRHRHEINLSNMAINKIQNRALHELVDLSLGFESDSKVKRMITAVAELAFQCLQNDKDMRPSMVEVLESLKGIKGQVTNVVKPEEVHIPADDVVLLKNSPLQLSPASVTVKWISSTSTTPNASG